MTTTALDPAPTSHRAEPRSWTKPRLVLAGAVLAVVALGLRLWGLATANELFIDEVTYSRLALSVSRGEWPNLAGHGFYLHPPLTFWLNGGVVKLLGLAADPTTLMFQLRAVNAVLGVVVVVLAYLILLRISTPLIAVIGGVLLAADPFVLRIDSRVMLETPAFALLLGGWLVLLIALGGTRRWLFVLSGLMIGLAVLAKDVTAVPGLLPLLLAPLWRRTLRLRTTLPVVGAALVPYFGYLVALSLAGRLGEWWHAKLGGLRRIAGIDQVSGFNSTGAPSLLEALANQLSRFGTSYVLLALAVPAGVLAARTGRADRKLIGLVAVLMGLLGLFSLGFGTLEEQMGYFVVIPGVLALAVVAADPPVLTRWWRPAFAAAAAVVVFAGLGFAVVARSTVDNSYQQARAFLDTRLPPGSRVGLTTPTAQFALHTGEGADLHIGTWASLDALHRFRADYVLTQSRPLGQGYGYASPDLLPWLAAHAEPVFRASGPSGGDTVVWRLDHTAVANAVATGDLIPEVVRP